MKDKYIIEKQKLRYIAFLLIILLLDVHFFDIPQIADKFQSVNRSHNKFLISAVVVVSYLFFLMKNRIYMKKKNDFDSFIVYYLGIVCVTFLGSIVVYDQSIVAVVRNYYYYVILLLYFPLRKMTCKESLYDCCLNLIVCVSTVYSIITLVAKVVYMATGKMLLSTTMLIVTQRNGSLRLQNISGIICFGCVIAFSLMLKRKRKIIYMLCSILCAAEVIWVSQTRMAELSILVAVCITLYLFSKTRSKYLLIAMGTILLFSFSASIVEFFNSFSVKNVDPISAYSTSIRLEAYDYFLHKIFYNALFGIGFINSDRYAYIKFGHSGKYVLSDLGYIGIFGVFGVLGIVLVCLLLKTFAKLTKKILLIGFEQKYPEAIALMAYILFSGWSLSFNDMQRILYLPICFMILNYIDKAIDNAMYIKN